MFGVEVDLENWNENRSMESGNLTQKGQLTIAPLHKRNKYDEFCKFVNLLFAFAINAASCIIISLDIVICSVEFEIIVGH